MRTPVHKVPLSTLIICSFLGGVSSAQSKQPLSVIVGEARVEQLFDRVEVLGTLRANESVDITATVTDTITVIHFEDGQRVKDGDILMEMTSKEEHALLEEELSTLAEAEKQYNRLTPLVARGAAAKSLLDQRERERLLGTGPTPCNRVASAGQADHGALFRRGWS